MELTSKMSKDTENNKECDVTDVLEKFGMFQVIQYTLVCVPTVFITMININYIFVAGDLDYRCKVPECEDTNSTVLYPSWWINTTDRCSRPTLKEGHSGSCANDSFTGTYQQCDEWVYESHDTIIADLNLACQPWKSNLVGTVNSAGTLVSMVISGWMADRFGRKPTIVFSAVAGCIGHFKTIATSYYVYILVEFIEATTSSGIYSALVLMLEIVGKEKRILSGVVFAYAIYLGETIFATIAMFFPYWKNLIRIINTPSILFISYIFLLKESLRWQIVNGKIEDAMQNIADIAKMNKVDINLEELNSTDGDKLKEKFNIESSEKKEGLKEIFGSKVIITRLLVASFCRFTASFVYYGLMINSVWLPGNKYTNFLLSTLMSFPGELVCLYLMNKIGRKMPLVVGYIICGMLCVGSACVPASYTWAKVGLFLLGKIIIAVCFTGAITYTMELFPTSTRGSLLSFGAFASRVGAMLAPLTPILNSVSQVIPPILFGGCSVLAGALLTLTPETKDLPLMDTIHQVHQSLNKQQKTNVPEGYTQEDSSLLSGTV